MKYLRMLMQIINYIRSFVFVLILARLVYLESIPAATFLEIIGGMGVLLTTPELDIIDHD